MRLGLLADVHSNLHALTAVMEDAAGHGIDEWLFLGDAVGYNADPLECVRILMGLDGTAIKGNHDEAVLTGRTAWFNVPARAGVEFSAKALGEAELDWLATLPEEASIATPAVRLHAVHGSPRDPLREYVFPHEPPSFFDELMDHPSVSGAGILVMGHTHVPLDRPTRRGRVLNPGSVGQPRDGDARAAWGFIDLPARGPQGVEVTMRRVPYDVEGAQETIRRAGLPEGLALRLGQGF